MAALPLVAGIVAGVGSLITGVAAIQMGNAQAEAYEQTAAYNARVAQMEATINENRLRREQIRRQARLRASIAGRGITLEGSPLEIMADSAAEAEEEALLVRYMGSQRASQILYEGQTSANFAKSEGVAKGLGAFGQGFGTILGSIGEYGEGIIWNVSQPASQDVGTGRGFIVGSTPR